MGPHLEVLQGGVVAGFLRPPSRWPPLASASYLGPAGISGLEMGETVKHPWGVEGLGAHSGARGQGMCQC